MFRYRLGKAFLSAPFEKRQTEFELDRMLAEGIQAAEAEAEAEEDAMLAGLDLEEAQPAPRLLKNCTTSPWRQFNFLLIKKNISIPRVHLLHLLGLKILID